MAKEFIVAIELGSSKITGIAGKKNLDGSISILSIVQEESSSYIRRGIVYNIDKTMSALISIKKKLESALQTKIQQVYVGVGGQSIISVKNVCPKDLPAECIVSQEMINELMDANRTMKYPDQEILDAITLEYKVDSQYQIDPVGIECQRIEGNFLNILWRKSFYRNLNKCFENAGIQIAEMYLAPLALADSVLAEAEKRAGCVLVDLGADTTTVSVYYKNILRHLAVIPLGGNNISRDIAILQMEESEAESMKLKYGSAYTENSEIDNTLQLPIDHERVVESRKFIEIVEGRLEEIVENVWFQVPAEYADKLLGGIVLTGGGANMKNIEKAFQNHTRIEKVRIAKTVNRTIDATQPEVTAHDCKLNTVIGLLAKGDMNCAGDEIKNVLFADEEVEVEHPVDTHRPARNPNEIAGKGIVQTVDEKNKADEEARKKREEEEEAAARKREEEEAAAKKLKKENSFVHKTWKNVKNFLIGVVTEEE